MMSFKIVSVGLCVLSWMIAPANADVLDQVRMASTGPFSFTITPASPLSVTPREPVNRTPLSAKPALPTPPTDVGAVPTSGDEAAKAKAQHDEEAARAGLHVAPHQEEAMEMTADHSAVPEAVSSKIDHAPSDAAGAYTPVPTDIDAVLKNVARTRSGPRQASTLIPVERPAIVDDKDVVVSSPRAPVPVPSTMTPSPPPTQNLPVVLPFPPQVIVIQPTLCPPPMVVSAAPPLAPEQNDAASASAMPRTMSQIDGNSDAHMPSRLAEMRHLQEMWRRQAWVQQRQLQMAQRRAAAVQHTIGSSRQPETYRMAFNHAGGRGPWVGGYRQGLGQLPTFSNHAPFPMTTFPGTSLALPEGNQR